MAGTTGFYEERGAVPLSSPQRLFNAPVTGKAYLSVKLDSPFLPASVNGALIEQEDGTHILVWNRDQRKAA